MSKILAEQLLAGIILAETTTENTFTCPAAKWAAKTRTAYLKKTVSAPATCRLKKQ